MTEGCRSARSARRRLYRRGAAAPKDFAVRALGLHLMGLARFYGVSQKVAERWCRETEARPIRFDFSAATRRQWEVNPIRPRAAVKQPRPPRPVGRAGFCLRQLARPIPPPEASLHGRAAHHLRRFAIVYRCTENGAAEQSGAHWRYGNVVLTPDALLARAARFGWSEGCRA